MNPSPRAIAAHLSRGGLIAYPTESCYGLGCDPRNHRAVQRLLKLKRRPQSKGLILVAARYQQVARYIQPLTLAEQQQLQMYGAAAITCLMPAQADCPRWLRGRHEALAVRIIAHSDAKKLCEALDMALVSTSANRSGRRPARTAAQCHKMFGDTVWALPGKIGARKRPSSIQRWGDGKIVRG
jgi:L-threonylcarbamoyladenylate synthase